MIYKLDCETKFNKAQRRYMNLKKLFNIDLLELRCYPRFILAVPYACVCWGY